MSRVPEKLYEDCLTQAPPRNEQSISNGSDFIGSMFASSIGAQQEQTPENPTDIQISIDCTLEEFYQGSIRTVNFDRMECHHDPKHSSRF